MSIQLYVRYVFIHFVESIFKHNPIYQTLFFQNKITDIINNAINTHILHIIYTFAILLAAFSRKSSL